MFTAIRQGAVYQFRRKGKRGDAVTRDGVRHVARSDEVEGVEEHVCADADTDGACGH